MNIAKCFIAAFLQNFSGRCFFIILKVFRNFATAISQRLFLKECPCYDVLIIFPSQHMLEKQKRLMNKNSNSFFLQICRQFPGFLNKSIRVYSKLKIGMLYHMNNSFRNTIF